MRERCHRSPSTMERLDGFVAGSLLQRLRHPAGDPTVATCASFRGAVLFVDISGYTALAEALCSQGPDGVEQLGRTLDLALRSQVRTVQATGGEIACFAGDAFIAYWPADDGNIPRALRKAHDCAAALHAGSRDSPPCRRPLPSRHCTSASARVRSGRRVSAPRTVCSCCSPGRQCDKRVRRQLGPLRGDDGRARRGSVHGLRSRRDR